MSEVSQLLITMHIATGPSIYNFCGNEYFETWIEQLEAASRKSCSGKWMQLKC